MFFLSFLLFAVASLWRHPNSPFWSACFTVRPSNLPPQRWKRSLRTDDRKLARQISDTVDDAGRNVLSEQAITAFTEKIRDAKARAAVAEIFADVFRSVSGREFGEAPYARSRIPGWRATNPPIVAIVSQIQPRCGRFSRFLGAAADRDLIGFGPRDDLLVLHFRDQLADRLAPASVNRDLKIVKQMFKTAAQRFKIESPAHFVPGVRKDADRQTAPRIHAPRARSTFCELRVEVNGKELFSPDFTPASASRI